MEKPADNILIQSIKCKSNEAFALLYEEYFPFVRAYVTRNSGKLEDAEDVFQDTMVILLQKVNQKNFTLTSSLKTYFIAIAKNQWLKRSRDNRLLPVESMEKYQPGTAACPVEMRPEKTNEEKMNVWLSKITANCQRILKALFFYREPIERIAKKMGWKNKHTAANQKYKCIEQVRRERLRSEKCEQ